MTFREEQIERGRKMAAAHGWFDVDLSDDEDCRDCAEQWDSGVVFRDPDGSEWGSWTDFNSHHGGCQVHVDQPELRISVEEATALPQTHGVRLDLCGKGQPDGPGTCGVIWAARICSLGGEQLGLTHLADDIDWAAGHAWAAFVGRYKRWKKVHRRKRKGGEKR